MRPIWYGDRRDRVKWGGLIHLSQQNNILDIVQVAYYRESPHPILTCDEGDFPVSEVVCKHFSNLGNIISLGRATNVRIAIIDKPFNPNSRSQYIAAVVEKVREVENPKIVFFDPDTGIAPRTAKPEHTTEDDLSQVWAILRKDYIIAVYQHAARSRTWLDGPINKMGRACGNEEVRKITSSCVAGDVALLWCKK